MILFSPDAVSDVERVREFLANRSPGAAQRALSVIFSGIEAVEAHPGLGRATDDPDIRQIVVPFGAAGYIVRYAILPEERGLLILRIWHGREARR